MKSQISIFGSFIAIFTSILHGQERKWPEYLLRTLSCLGVRFITSQGGDWSWNVMDWRGPLLWVPSFSHTLYEGTYRFKYSLANSSDLRHQVCKWAKLCGHSGRRSAKTNWGRDERLWNWRLLFELGVERELPGTKPVHETN